MSDNVFWVAEYKDGTSLSQFEGGKENSSERIDRRKLSRIRLIAGNVPIVTQFYPDGAKVIFRRRVEQNASGIRKVAYLLGWSMGGHKHLSLVRDSDFGGYVIENYTDFDEKQPWLSPVVPVPVDDIEVGS